MLKQTLINLEQALGELISEETKGIEQAYANLKDKESLSLSFSCKIIPPDDGPDVDLQVDLGYVIEKRKARKILKIDENQMKMQFREELTNKEDVDFR